MKRSLHISDDVYYMEYYIPANDFSSYGEREVAFSKAIWDYKDGDHTTMLSMTEKYISAIREILLRESLNTYVGLIAAPPSKVGKYSPVSESIKQIYKYYKTKTTKERKPFWDYKIKDFSDLLKRKTDIPSSHAEKRASYTDHRTSISCTYKLDHYQSMSYIIMDDVATSGKLLYACEDILIEYGANPNHIYKLVLAKTI